MKKLLLMAVITTISLFSTSLNTNAQEVEFGAKALLGTSTITDETNQGLTFSYGIGASLEFKLADMFAIQPELLYVSKGGSRSLDINVLNTTVDINTKLTYIEIPVLAKVIIGNNGVFIGPYFGINIGSNVTMTQTQGLNSFKPDFNLLDFGFTLGYERKIQNRMYVDGRVNFGVTKITDGADIYNSINPYKDPKNFSVIFGFKYVLF